MTCPHCGRPLVHEAVCSSCPSCGANWFTLEQARTYFGFAIQEAPRVSTPGWRAAPSGLPCFGCAGTMDRIEVGPDLILDQCSRCFGLFFDAGELLKLKSMISGGRGPELRRMLEAIIVGRHGPYR